MKPKTRTGIVRDEESFRSGRMHTGEVSIPDFWRDHLSKFLPSTHLGQAVRQDRRRAQIMQGVYHSDETRIWRSSLLQPVAIYHDVNAGLICRWQALLRHPTISKKLEVTSCLWDSPRMSYFGESVQNNLRMQRIPYIPIVFRLLRNV